MILTIFLCIAIFQGIVLGIIVLGSPLFKSKANNYLAYAILSLSVLLLNLVFEITETDTASLFFQILDSIGMEFLVPVFIYLFIAHQVNHPVASSKRILWLYTPFLFCAVLNIYSDLETVAQLYKTPGPILLIIELLRLFDLVFVIIFIPLVLIFAYYLIKCSNDTQEKRWLTALWIQIFLFFISFPLALLLAVISSLFFDYDIIPSAMRTLAVFASFLIHWTVYYGIFKFRLARDQEEIRALINKQASTKPTLVHTLASQSKATEVEKVEIPNDENVYFKKLEDLCINHHLYRDSSLDRNRVAEKLGISPGYVSQIVNTVTGDNFSTYINRYRVEAVKKIILDPEFAQYSLLAIGLECGFSSKTTFYNSFKKITGITPNTYRKMNK